MSQYKCPKCPGYMQTYNRSGIHIEQCGQCHGIFLDAGEVEALSRAEAQWAQTSHNPPPAPPPNYHQQPGWSNYGYHGHHGRKKGFASMLFSS